MAEVDTSSYPKPQPQQNPLDQIVKFGQVANVIGDLEAGKAVQGAIGPDGEIDRNSLAQALKGTVAGSMKALPTLQAHETLKNAGFGADQQGLETFRKRMELVNGVFGHIAAKDKPSIDDVNSAAAHLLSPAANGPKYGLTFPVVMDALKRFRGPDGRPLNSAQIKQLALDMQTMTLHSLEQIGVVAPQSENVDTGVDIRRRALGSKINPKLPVDIKRIPTGTPQIDTDPSSPTFRQPVLTPPQEPAPTMQMNQQGNVLQPTPVQTQRIAPTGPGAAVGPTPGEVITPEQRAMGQNKLAEAFQDRYGSKLKGAPAAGLAPGVVAAAESTGKSSADLGNQLVAAANQVPVTESILQNLDRTLKDFTPGPGADWTRVGKAFVNRTLPESLQKKIGFDPKSIASQEEFNKLAYNLAQDQFQALGGTGTDAKLNSTMSTSPSELLSKEGNRGVVQLLRGNADALKAKSKAWNNWKKQYGENTFSDFSQDFNENFNPRVFQIKYVPKNERNSWYQSMSPEDRRKFEAAAVHAKDKGWLKKEDLQ